MTAVQVIRTQLNQSILSPSSHSPIIREYPADLETPVSVYLKLAGTSPSFLLESVTGGAQLGRYSFIGANPRRAYLIRGRTITALDRAREVTSITLDAGMTPLDYLRGEISQVQSGHVDGLPRFSGGLVGYCGYELIHFFEPSVPVHGGMETPDGIFLMADTVVAFDHAYGKLILIANVLDDDLSEGDPAAEANARLDEIEARISQPLPARLTSSGEVTAKPLHLMVSQDEYESMVCEAKELIAAGEIFQVVLSQAVERETGAAPFEIYRSLRRLNPSPYLFFFDFRGLPGAEKLSLIGASPEMNVRLEGRKATIRPIAGTRPRGKTAAEDLQFEQELFADPKELAEHIMLVDLARNDLGRVCRYGSVHVTEQMQVERYSHVMHIVSQVEGELSADLDGFDLVRATFPAGTVSGAPKIRAMQIIHDLEQNPRGPYAGLVGYFGMDGSLDTCIAIRTLVMDGQTVRIQAGAGIVADSDPGREYVETLNKARALEEAIKDAELNGGK